MLDNGTIVNGETICSQNEMQIQVDKITKMMNNINDSVQALQWPSRIEQQ